MVECRKYVYVKANAACNGPVIVCNPLKPIIVVTRSCGIGTVSDSCKEQTAAGVTGTVCGCAGALCNSAGYAKVSITALLATIVVPFILLQ